MDGRSDGFFLYVHFVNFNSDPLKEDMEELGSKSEYFACLKHFGKLNNVTTGQTPRDGTPHEIA